MNIYQIQTKFRDEIRPRYGVMRSREFLMKDSYSFHLSEASLEETYQIMRNAYSKIFERIGLDFKIVKADSGAIGGDKSEEFHVLAENGEDTLAVSDKSDYAVNAELLLEDGQDSKSLVGQESPDGNGLLEITKGIEVGHIFQLGKLYSENMNATVLDDSGKAKNMHMGCYGIGISRIVAAAIEQNFDDKGIIWPKSISPFNLNIITIGADKDKNIEASSRKLYKELTQKGFEVILDDRDDGFGKKIKDSELIGVPVSIVFGKNFTDHNKVEIIFRNGEKVASALNDEGANLNDLAEMRLIEDMAPLTFQVFSVVHHSVGAIDALKTGEFAPPKMPENLNFNDLIDMLENAEEKLNHFSDEDINSLSGKEVMFRMGQIEWAFTAEDFILSFSLPNFYFHVTTLYDLFRVKGLEIGKLDFAGVLRIKN